jgi:hypothetical protein
LSSSKVVVKQWRPRYAWMDKTGAMTTTTMMALVPVYAASLPSTQLPVASRHCMLQKQQPAVGRQPAATMIALRRTSHCRRPSALDVVVEVNSEESIPDVALEKEDSPAVERFESVFEQDQDESQLEGHLPCQQKEINSTTTTTIDDQVTMQMSSCSSSSSCDSADSGTNASVDDGASRSALATNDWPYDHRTAPAIKTPPGGANSTQLDVPVNDVRVRSDDRALLTDGVLDHMTGLLRSISDSTHHLLRRQLNVATPPGTDTEQLIDESDVSS